MFKKSLLLGIVSGLLAGVAGVIYARVYHSSLGADFSKVAPTIRIIMGSLAGGVLAAIGYFFADRWLKDKGELVFNLIFSLISFATLLAPFAVKLPLDLEAPELFPGMVIPMHFFPALAWFTLKPLFIKSR
jgi:H+/Cl- antiporter ClcA